MKIKNKGKVHPSPSSSSPLPSYSPNGDAFSVLRLLPAAILALVSVLSLEDREVLAYMITRSMKVMNPSSVIEEKKKCKRLSSHKPPHFDCGCFDCYTSYWFRWDSSPNRELIHQAIEAFDDHLANGELVKNSRGKKRDKMGHRPAESRPTDELEQSSSKMMLLLEKEPETPEATSASESEEQNRAEPEVETSPAVESVAKADDLAEYHEEDKREDVTVLNPPEDVFGVQAPASHHKGLARKVLPDVLGLFNSRLWSLWSPNV